MRTTTICRAAVTTAGAVMLAGTISTSAAAGMADNPVTGARVFGADHAPVTDARLAQLRGGTVKLPDGIVSIGVSVVGDINGQALEDAINFTFNKRFVSGNGDTSPTVNVTDEGLGDDGMISRDNVRVAVDGDGLASTQTLVQTGSGTLQGSVVNSSARGVLTAVQNNLNNIDIKVTNKVNIQTNGNVGAASISDALRRVADGATQ